jgi:hypothetical protein
VGIGVKVGGDTARVSRIEIKPMREQLRPESLEYR